ncbi:hypothetical protein L873DRAFT_1816425 [Choiromyces venosus 120613-1]|uniref:Uncharacterized protein n=1 Tax=Choiromyces venosus 120613-1 TaxID=1336337 RepID=A0A3N4J4D9_9PEZI|nr:hypothetical protein L873DRAFT_1816425 [Choiromyces venosus 120613-1]
MPDSKYKIVKDGWGTRVNFQTCYGLGMTSEDLEEGDHILAQMQRVDAIREQQYAQRGE